MAAWLLFQSIITSIMVSVRQLSQPSRRSVPKSRMLSVVCKRSTGVAGTGVHWLSSMQSAYGTGVAVGVKVTVGVVVGLGVRVRVGVVVSGGFVAVTVGLGVADGVCVALLISVSEDGVRVLFPACACREPGGMEIVAHPAKRLLKRRNRKR